MRRNIVRCKHCNTIIESKHVHDFVTCKCGKVSCDGGSDYQRILWKEGNMEDSVEILDMKRSGIDDIDQGA